MHSSISESLTISPLLLLSGLDDMQAILQRIIFATQGFYLALALRQPSAQIAIGSPHLQHDTTASNRQRLHDLGRICVPAVASALIRAFALAPGAAGICLWLWLWLWWL